MIKIHILDTPPRHRLRPVPANWYPLYINRRAFLRHGISFSFFTRPTSDLSACDILFLSSRFFSLQQKTGNKHKNTLATIASLTQKTKSVWFDFRDSTGNTQFEVLPFVNLYLKSQLLKDLSLYHQSFYGNRLYTDFIHRRFNITDNYQEPCLPLPPHLIDKIGLSWNPGLMDFRGGTKATLLWHTVTDYLEKSFFLPHRAAWRPPQANRPYHMLANFNTNYGRQTVAWQRRHVDTVLDRLNDPLIIHAKPMSLAREIYYRRHAKIVLSLFGWGELCSRDFQCFIAGAALLAPDTSHLITWPATHIPYKTYYPFRWDLSDLPKAYHHLINNSAERLALAQAGQDTYRRLWSAPGKREFIDRLTKIITELLDTGHSPTARP